MHSALYHVQHKAASGIIGWGAQLRLLPVNWYSFHKHRKDDRLSEPYLVLIQRHNRGSNSRLEDLKPDAFTVKPTPNCPHIFSCYNI